MSLFERWQGLVAEPLQFVRGASLGGCFADELPEAVLQAMQGQPRFRQRLEQLLVSHYQLAPMDQLIPPVAADLPVLLLSPAQFARLPRQCGAIWHASTLSREIRREVVNELREGLGAEVFVAALALRQLGGAADLLRDPAELVEAIDRDGQGCVAAWLHAQHADWQGWLRLRFAFPQGDGARVPRDLEIVQAAAACLLAEEITP
ncbi:type III secretion protein [Pseudomonas pergaminensis]|uniref:Type III secretion protein n=1 Tax=Pseudomonas pergaminensis TaxID=2853159 RepID=A0ABD7TNN0_9PSED|nr:MULTISPECIES: type III secretion protein [Pseudomonas]MBT1261896.1 type III secretion protein [Pseudomonas sp. VS40]MBT1273811.1 type III secretion protein [Pseudomonas sp. VS59]PJK33606.1 type III secretion protein [Pseudomonas sp. S09F 262]PJK43101.1 type III secretion protein [Pseudomonas sp. S10E 269]USW03178.1 type III secretion protein [Pseudomonas pergaminensis]